jgi:lipid-A-disaccharide synthase-like uncharacterized protein
MHTPEPGLLQPFLGSALPWLYADTIWWTALGLLGNGMFAARFYVQWLVSERQKRLVVPPLFWYLSFWGSLLSLLYALHLDKLPIILAFAALPFVHGRNLALLRRGRQTETRS